MVSGRTSDVTTGFLAHSLKSTDHRCGQNCGRLSRRETFRLWGKYTRTRGQNQSFKTWCVIQAARVWYGGPDLVWADDLTIGQLLRGLWALKIPLKLQIIRSVEGGDPVLVMHGADDSNKMDLERVIANVGYIDQRHCVSTMPTKGASQTTEVYSGLTSQRPDAAGAVRPVHEDAIEEGAVGASMMSRAMKSTSLTSGNSSSNVQCLICSSQHDEANMILCNNCDADYHTSCLDPPMSQIPEGEWLCLTCRTIKATLVCRIYGKSNYLKNCLGCARPFHMICVRSQGFTAGDSWRQRRQCPQCVMANNNTRPRPAASQRSRVAPGCTAADKCAECFKAARRWSARCQSCAYVNHSFHRCRIQFQHDDPNSTNENSKASDR